MVTRKDFNLAAIRIFCDMIVADGLIVGSELAEFEKWQNDYGLIGEPFADEHIIQEAHGLTLCDAIKKINAYNRAMIKAGDSKKMFGICDEVNTFINRLKSIALADGECSPNEARLLLAINYAVRKKEGIVFSIPKDRLRLSRKEILVLEGDMDNTAFLEQLFLRFQEIQGCSLDFAGWESINTDQTEKKEYKEKIKFLNFTRFIRDKHSAILGELSSNRELYKDKIATYGFDLIDIRDCLSQLLDVSSNNGELLSSALKLVNPAIRYGLDVGSIKTIIEHIRPSDITDSLFHGCEFKYIVPSLLVKIGNSTKWTLGGKVEKHTDVLLINIKGFTKESAPAEEDQKLLLTAIDELLDNFIEPMGKLTHTVSIDKRRAFHVHGFHNTLLNYAIQKVGKSNGIERIDIEMKLQQFTFYFKERKPIHLKFEKSAHFIYYLLLLCIQRIPKRKRSLDFLDFEGKITTEERDNYKKNYQKYYNIYYSFNKLYNGETDMNVYKVKSGSTDPMQIFHGQVKRAIKEQLSSVDTTKFIPDIDSESGCYYIDTSEYRHLLFVTESSGTPIPIDDWIANKQGIFL